MDQFIKDIVFAVESFDSYKITFDKKVVIHLSVTTDDLREVVELDPGIDHLFFVKTRRLCNKVFKHEIFEALNPFEYSCRILRAKKVTIVFEILSTPLCNKQSDIADKFKAYMMENKEDKCTVQVSFRGRRNDCVEEKDTSPPTPSFWQGRKVRKTCVDGLAAYIIVDEETGFVYDPFQGGIFAEEKQVSESGKKWASYHKLSNVGELLCRQNKWPYIEPCSPFHYRLLEMLHSLE